MKLIFKILIPFVVLLVGIFVIIDYFAVETIRSILLEESAVNLIRHINTAAQETFTKNDLEKSISEASLSAKMTDLTKRIDDPAVFRFKIWDNEPKIIYSDLANLIGAKQDNSMPVVRSLLVENSSSRWILRSSNDPKNPEKAFGTSLNILVPVKDIEGNTRFIVEIFVTTSAAMSILQSRINNIVYLLVILGIVFSLLIYGLVELSISRRVRKLAEAMDVVGAGHLSFETIDKSSDEVGSLYKNFNHMRLQLKQYLEDVAKSKQEEEKAQQVLEKTNSDLQTNIEELEAFKRLTVGRELKMVEMKEELAKLKKEGSKADVKG